MAWKTKPPYNIPVNPAHPLANGLQGCWLFNEGEGLVANDISGNVNTGTLIGAPAWTTGNGGGNALSFDGVNNIISLPASVRPVAANSIEILFKAASVSDFPTLIGGRTNGNLDSKGGVAVGFASGNLRYQLYDSTQTVAVSISSPPTWVGTWYHAIGTWDGTSGTDKVKLYLDGSLSSSGSGLSGAIDYTGFPLFRVGYGYRNYFQGQISLVRIWSRALTAAEVLSLYNAPYDMFLDPQINFLRGTATVTQGNTTAVVTHALGFVPSLVWLQPLSDSGKKWFITNRTATQFTINLPVAQQADVSFNYGVA